MIADYVQEGKTINYTNSTDETITAGTVVVFGERCGVAGCNIEPGELGTLHMCGVFAVPKGSTAISEGVTLCYDAENDVATTTKTGNALIGYSVAAAGKDAKTVLVSFGG